MFGSTLPPNRKKSQIDLELLATGLDIANQFQFVLYYFHLYNFVYSGGCMQTQIIKQDFNQDVLFSIFSFLDTKSLCQASLVCKSWYPMATSDYLWKSHCERQIPSLSFKKICQLNAFYKQNGPVHITFKYSPRQVFEVDMLRHEKVKEIIEKVESDYFVSMSPGLFIKQINKPKENIDPHATVQDLISQEKSPLVLVANFQKKIIGKAKSFFK